LKRLHRFVGRLSLTVRRRPRPARPSSLSPGSPPWACRPSIWLGANLSSPKGRRAWPPPPATMKAAGWNPAAFSMCGLGVWTSIYGQAPPVPARRWR